MKEYKTFCEDYRLDDDVMENLSIEHWELVGFAYEIPRQKFHYIFMRDFQGGN